MAGDTPIGVRTMTRRFDAPATAAAALTLPQQVECYLSNLDTTAFTDATFGPCFVSAAAARAAWPTARRATWEACARVRLPPPAISFDGLSARGLHAAWTWDEDGARDPLRAVLDGVRRDRCAVGLFREREPEAAAAIDDLLCLWMIDLS